METAECNGFKIYKYVDYFRKQISNYKNDYRIQTLAY